jgi:hypothetical protein
MTLPRSGPEKEIGMTDSSRTPPEKGTLCLTTS